MTKNEVKKLAKTAKSIISNERDTDSNMSTYQTETTVTYEAMIEALSHCGRWAGAQYGNKILVSGTIASFTIEL